MSLTFRIQGGIMAFIRNIVAWFVSKIVGLIKWPIDVAFNIIARAKKTIFATVTLGAVLLVLLWISIFVYGSFYYSYVPTLTHSKDVNLQFSVDCKPDEKCGYPKANMTLVAPGQAQLLAAGQTYSIGMFLDMPESQLNQDTGMFMVKLQLYTYFGDVVRESSRAVSSILRYKNPLFQILETVFYFPLYIIGWSEQKQTLFVEIFTNFVDDPYRPIQGAYVEIQSHGVHIYQADLQLDAKLSGLRYIMYQFPLTSACLGISIIMFFLMILTLLSWYKVMIGSGDNPQAQLLLMSPSDSTSSRNPDTAAGRSAETLASSPSPLISDWAPKDTASHLSQAGEASPQSDVRQRKI